MMVWDSLLSNYRLSEKHKPDDKADSDYKRIITSPAFRRLQDKTQVFPLNRGDFVRTRLTHSLEVSAIAREIANNKKLDNIWIDNQRSIVINILESSSLLHDIGNPPFGHFGETIIRNWFISNEHKLKLKEQLSPQQVQDFWNFEGNAQALRIVTKLHQFSGVNGMDLSVATLSTLLKYTRNSIEDNKEQTNKIVDKKVGYFQAETETFNRIIEKTGTGRNRHPLTFILESADDIAYLTADIEDGIKKGIVDFSLFKSQFLTLANERKLANPREFDTIFSDLINEDNKNVFFLKIKNKLIWCVAYNFSSHYQEIMEGIYNDDLFQNGFSEALHGFLTDFARKNIFNDKSILKLEIAGNTILNFLLEKFIFAVIDKHNANSNALSKRVYALISESQRNIYESIYNNETIEASDKLYHGLLMVTDFISGMTDNYAHELYMELSGQEI